MKAITAYIRYSHVIITKLIKEQIQLNSTPHLSTKESVEIIMFQLLYCQKRNQVPTEQEVVWGPTAFQ